MPSAPETNIDQESEKLERPSHARFGQGGESQLEEKETEGRGKPNDSWGRDLREFLMTQAGWRSAAILTGCLICTLTQHILDTWTTD